MSGGVFQEGYAGAGQSPPPADHRGNGGHWPDQKAGGGLDQRKIAIERRVPPPHVPQPPPSLPP